MLKKPSHPLFCYFSALPGSVLLSVIFQPLSYSVNWKTLEFTTSLCLKLVEICLKKLTLKGNLDVIGQAIKLLFASICRQRREVNESLDQDKRQESEENTISQFLMSLRTRIVSDLSHTMSSYSRSDSLRRELLVCKGRKCWVRLEVMTQSQVTTSFQRTPKFIKLRIYTSKSSPGLER